MQCVNSFKVAAVLDHNFEQCSKEKLNMHLHISSNSVQDVDGLVARPRLVTSELIFLSACLEQELLNSCFPLEALCSSRWQAYKNRSGLANSRGFYI